MHLFIIKIIRLNSKFNIKFQNIEMDSQLVDLVKENANIVRAWFHEYLVRTSTRSLLAQGIVALTATYL